MNSLLLPGRQAWSLFSVFIGFLLSATTPVWGADVHLTDNQSAVASSSFSGNVYFDGDNASYSVSSGVNIRGTYIVGDNKSGNSLYFEGASESISQIGSSSSQLDTVIFNRTDNGTELTLSNDVWASSVTLGNGLASETSVRFSGLGITFGGNLILRNLFTFLDVNTTRSTVEGGLITNGGVLSFQLTSGMNSNTTIWSAGNFEVLDGAGSGKLTANGLTLDGSELFLLTYETSFKDNTSYTLIENNGSLTGAYSNGETLGFVQDNSYILESEVQATSDNQTVLTISRTADVYITKSYSEGHFSNGAARALGTIAQQGQQLGDLVEVINQLDLNGYGYGNNYVNLSRQVQLLAPVANNSYTMLVLEATDLAGSPLSRRLFSRSEQARLDVAPQGAHGWSAGYGQQGHQNGLDAYDGYRTSVYGLSAGADLLWGEAWLLGAAYSSGVGSVEQDGFRSGERASLEHQLSSVYLGANFQPYLVDLVWGTGSAKLEAERQTALDRTAQGKLLYDLQQASLRVAWRYEMEDGRSVVVPLLGREQLVLKRPSYSESGAGDLSLFYESRELTRVRWYAGVSYHSDWRMGASEPRLSLTLRQSRDHGLGDRALSARYTGPTADELSEFTTETLALKNDSLLLSGEVSWKISAESVLKLGYELNHRVGFNGQTAQAQFQWRF